MKPRTEQIELENMALTAEVSRQLVHDFSNFVYNLLLQIEILEKSNRPTTDWASIKREGKKMAHVLHEWEQFHNRCSAEEPTRVDLHQLIRAIASDTTGGDPAILLAPSISADPLWFTSCALAASHLLRILLAEQAPSWRESAGVNPPVSIRTEKTSDRVIVQMVTPAKLAVPSAEKGEAIPGDRSRSLLAATCQTIAQRLDATIQREPVGDRESVVKVEFPLTIGGAR